jgi:hypothetical protein
VGDGDREVGGALGLVAVGIGGRLVAADDRDLSFR